MIQWYQIFVAEEPATHWLRCRWGSRVASGESFFTPKAEPLYPAELSQPGVDESPPDWPTAATKDFILRPLFSAARRPEAPVIIEEVAPPPMKQSERCRWRAYHYLVFLARLGKGGAILELEDSTRTRLYVGEQLNGWTLTDTHLQNGDFYLVLRQRNGAQSGSCEHFTCA